LRVRDRYEQRFDRLPAQVPPGFVDHSARDHQWHAVSDLFECISDREQGRFPVECVENGFHNEQIDPAFEQRFHFIEISLAKLIE
jgi:hypothetical protein